MDAVQLFRETGLKSYKGIYEKAREFVRLMIITILKDIYTSLDLDFNEECIISER